MRDGWTNKRLGEMCDILDNLRKPITKRNRVAGKYPYYGATGIVDYVNNFIFDEPLVLVGEDGAKWASGESTAFQVKGKCWVNNHAHVLKPHRTDLLDNWLIYFLNYSDLSEFVSGLTVPKLNQGNLREISIPLPPLAEQKRIVAILDEAFAGLNQVLANTEKNLANARELFEGYLDEVFTRKGEGWVEKRLSEIIERQPRNGWSPPAKNHSESGTPVLTLSAVTGFEFDSSKRKYTSAPTKKGAHYWVDNGDLLIGRSNTPLLVGHVAICSRLTEPTIYPDLIMKMKVNSELASTRFVYYQLRSYRLREVIMNSAQGANPTMKKINKGIVQGLPIVLPKLSEQTDIANRLDQMSCNIKSLESIYRKRHNSLTELKQSILQKAFTGELTNDLPL